MPGVSGLDLLAQVARAPPRTLVVLITAYATVETAVEALREGASDFVSAFQIGRRPFRVQRLLEYRATLQESAQFAQGRRVRGARPKRSSARARHAGGGGHQVAKAAPP